MKQTRIRKLKDQFARWLLGTLTIAAAALVPIIMLALLTRAQPLLDITPLGKLLTFSEWHPLQHKFGFLPFIVGTLWVTALAMILAVPPSLLCAIYLAEYAPRYLREIIKPLVDLLAGIPSVAVSYTHLTLPTN